MKLFLPILLLSVLIVSFAQPSGKKCKAYAIWYYISHKDTLDFIGENRFEIAVHSDGRNERLTGIYTQQDGLVELTFDAPKGEEIRHKAFYMQHRNGFRYVKKGSDGFYGYKGQRFKYVERPW